jgi:predicted ATPase/class 3 adenylate cyclase
MNSGPTTGTFIFLFTDIEGSTRLWETEPVRMADALARHDRLCQATVAAHGGRLVKMVGDGLHAVFDDPVAAVASVLDLQRGMAAIGAQFNLPFKMRCGLHAGTPQLRDGDYFGSAVNRAARIMSAGHGGQVLLSQAVVDLGRGRFPAGADVVHLGRVRLRDLSTPEELWQLVHVDLPRQFPPLRSLDLAPNNLPEQFTSFVGREHEVAKIKDALRASRALTLTGAGGCGKTRLSLEVAAEMLEWNPDGVWFVQLASLADSDLVPQTAATVLGLRERPGTSFTQVLADHVADKHLMLILDNAEHVLAACARLAGEMLRSCPHLTLLATSREPLRIAGEVSYRVPPLSMPDLKRDATPERVSRFESSRLFIERAQQSLPRFAVTSGNARALVSVCRRLDGMPLAIELAAARVRSMSVEELDEHLDRRFRLVTGGSRVAPRRQQTLRALIDWSYDLLDDAEKKLLCRASTFSGGLTLEAAEHVCSGQGIESWEVLDILTSLTDKSLVVAEEHERESRYRLLETVREYAREALRASDPGAHWHSRHLAYFLAMSQEGEPHLFGADQKVWLDRLETEHDNLRAALAWSTAGEDAAAGLRMAGSLWWFWNVRGYLREGRRWLSALLAAAPEREDDARAKALNGVGGMAFHQADYAAARAAYEDTLAIARRLDNRPRIAFALNNLAIVAHEVGDYSVAETLNEEALAIQRELGDPRGINISLHNLGTLAGQRGDYAAARTLYEESLAIRRSQGDRQAAAVSLNNLGVVAALQGDYASARSRHAESLRIRGELGDQWGVAESLEGLAIVELASSAAERAACMWGAAERVREEIGIPIQPRERPEYDRHVAAAREAIGNPAFETAWQEGRIMSLREAVDFSLGSSNA